MTIDPFELRYLTARINTYYDASKTPPEETHMWTGGGFLEALLPAEGWRYADGRALLLNAWRDPIWLGLPSREIKRPPRKMDLDTVSRHKIHTLDLTEAQARRRGSAALKAWGLPVPTVQDFIAVVRPIIRAKHIRITTEIKREEVRQAREEQRERERRDRENSTPEALARAEQARVNHEAWKEKRRLEDAEYARLGMRRPVRF